MDSYEDVLAARGEQPGDLPHGAHYHRWTPETIAALWTIWANNPFLRDQFYPPRYYEALFAEARPHLGRVGVAADIGCGSGTVMSVMRRKGIGDRLIGVDLSEASLAALRVKFERDRHCAFQTGSIDRTGLEAASCDLVVCTETLEHLFPGDFDGGLAEIARVLKPGARFLATLPLEERPNFVACPECRAIFTPYQHMLFNFTIAELGASLRRHGLEIVHVIHPIDTGVPRVAWRRFVKDRILTRYFPGLARRLFRVNGLTGFVAAKTVSATPSA